MESYYEITVSHQTLGHIFATAPRSIRSISELERVQPLVEEKFTEEEGYKVSVTYWNSEGTILK